ncbi:GTP-binding protein [Amycolatopsis sp. NPDC004368]
MLPSQMKILIAGGFGAGKTTFVRSISEITPLSTEETLTQASIAVDSLDGVANKKTTTVALDFGRRTIAEDLRLLLFGTPGQDRFWFMWNELSRGAFGAIVLVDTRRITDSFGPIEFFESRGIRFLVAVNQFQGTPMYPESDVRAALELRPHVPLIRCDARIFQSTRDVLIRLVEHIVNMRRDEDAARGAAPVPSGSGARHDV